MLGQSSGPMRSKDSGTVPCTLRIPWLLSPSLASNHSVGVICLLPIAREHLSGKAAGTRSPVRQQSSVTMAPQSSTGNTLPE